MRNAPVPKPAQAFRLLAQVLGAMLALTLFAALTPARAAEAPLEMAMDTVLVVHTADDQNRFLGSAFLWGAGEVAVTNAHVVGTAAEVRLTDHHGRSRIVPVIARDPVRDVAVIGLGAGGPAGLPLGPLPLLGEPVWALGAPLGLDFTATRGMVSARARQIEAAVPLRLLQHDAAVNPGSSGGPLIDGEGRVVGMNSQIADGSRHYIGIGYAIAAPDLARIVEGLVAETLRPVPKLGLQLRPVSRQIGTALGLGASGALVDRVEQGSRADRAGLEPGDVILGAGGAAIDGPGALAFAVEDAGARLALTVWRAGAVVVREIDLAPEAEEPFAVRDLAGADLARVGSYSFDALGVSFDDEGRVTTVTENSPALFAGLARGDRIEAVNGTALALADLRRFQINAPVLLRIRRDGGATLHILIDPWDRSTGLRPVGGANVLDPAVVLF